MSQASQNVDLQIGELFNGAWRLFTENAGILVGAVALLMVISIGLCMIPFAGGLLLMAGEGPLQLGFVAIAMTIVKGGKPEFGLLFSGFQRFLPAFLAFLLVSIFTGVGTVLCIVPGLFVAMIYMLTFFYMYDQNLEFWDSMEASRKTIMGNLGSWIVVALVLAVINILGGLVCGVGVLVSAPLTALILALAYEKVEGAVDAAATAGGTDEEM